MRTGGDDIAQAMALMGVKPTWDDMSGRVTGFEVLPVFGFGEPAFKRLVTHLREGVIREAAESDLPGLIFTYVWAFDQPNDLKYVRRMANLYEERGGVVIYPELWADLETRLVRNESESRLEAKSSKRDVERSRLHMLDVEQRHRLSSGGDFPLERHLWVDNSRLSALEAATVICEHFELR